LDGFGIGKTELDSVWCSIAIYPKAGIAGGQEKLILLKFQKTCLKKAGLPVKGKRTTFIALKP